MRMKNNKFLKVFFLQKNTFKSIIIAYLCHRHSGLVPLPFGLHKSPCTLLTRIHQVVGILTCLLVRGTLHRMRLKQVKK